MAMFLTEISKTVTDARIGKTGHAILLDADYKVIAHGRPEKVKSTLQDFSGHPALAIEGVTQKPGVYVENGKKIVAFVRKLPQGWNLLVVQDYDEAYASLAGMENNARLLILITTVLVIAIAFFLGKQLTQPINHLTAVAEELSSGKFDTAIPQTSRGDEIGSLARAVERMGFSIRLAMERLRYSKAA
jgi:methyl-accepting chemotaxis protein